MTTRNEGSTGARGEEARHASADRAFVERVAAVYHVPDRSPASNAAFDARLAERLERRHRAAPWLAVAGAAGALAAAAAVLALVFSSLGGSGEAPGEAHWAGTVRESAGRVTPGASADSEGDAALLALVYGEEDLSSWGATGDAGRFDESLPREYAAIGELFFDG